MCHIVVWTVTQKAKCALELSITVFSTATYLLTTSLNTEAGNLPIDQNALKFAQRKSCANVLTSRSKSLACRLGLRNALVCVGWILATRYEWDLSTRWAVMGWWTGGLVRELRRFLTKLWCCRADEERHASACSLGCEWNLGWKWYYILVIGIAIENGCWFKVWGIGNWGSVSWF